MTLVSLMSTIRSVRVPFALTGSSWYIASWPATVTAVGELSYAWVDAAKVVLPPRPLSVGFVHPTEAVYVPGIAAAGYVEHRATMKIVASTGSKAADGFGVGRSLALADGPPR